MGNFLNGSRAHRERGSFAEPFRSSTRRRASCDVENRLGLALSAEMMREHLGNRVSRERAA